MTQTEPMNWQVFKDALVRNPDKLLQFQYAEGEFVHSSFHITEIKQASIVSVDCGGQMNKWTEVIVQLWEPPVKEADRSMNVNKALSIIYLVEKSLLLNPLSIVKIEFGNSQFDTRQMYPGALIAEGDTFTVNLTPDYTQCKAQTRPPDGYTSSADESCCISAPKQEVFQPISATIEAEAPICAPGSGGCSSHPSRTNLFSL